MSNEQKNVLEIKGLRKSFSVGFWGRKVEALKGIDLDIHKNEVFGFLGPNGAGKTTTIKAILRLIYPTEGSIKILGVDHSNVSVRERIGFLPENPYFYDYLTASEFMEFYGKLAGVGKADRASRSKELLRKVGLEGKENIQLRKFSKGMVQRVGLAQALINNPDVVILDEPMSGLDPIGRKEIRDIILDLKKDGRTVFFSSHILPDVEMICDRVGIISGGSIIGVGAIDEIMKAGIKGVEITVKGIKAEDFPALGYSGKVSRGDATKVIVDDQAASNEFIRRVIEKGGSVIEVFPKRESLEDYFIKSFDHTGGAGK